MAVNKDFKVKSLVATGTLTSSNLAGVNTGDQTTISGNAATATKLQTARAINGIPFDGTANIQNTEWVHSGRDFLSGTLITTNIDYSVSEGAPFVLEIKGNSYGTHLPFDIQCQGYIYSGTIINYSGYSTGTNISGLVAINNGGNLCFWFPRQSYWQGFNVKVYTAYGPSAVNTVTNITDVAQPTSAKLVDFSAVIKQVWHTGNLTNVSQLANDTGYVVSSGSVAYSTKAGTLAQGGGGGTAMTFNWSGQTGQPSWLWGSNDGANHYVYNPSNFSVSYAASAGSVAWTNVSGRPTNVSSFTNDAGYVTSASLGSSAVPAYSAY